MRLLVEISPHQKARYDTKYIMWQVVIALLPPSFAAIIFFKLLAVKLIAVCVLGTNLTEAAVLFFRRRPQRFWDGSATVTGLLLALILPPALPLSVAFLGSVVAILVGKQLFGGLGQNIFNPALVGRAFLIASFPALLTSWTEPYTLDAVTSASPLALWKFNHVFTKLPHLFLGDIPGSLGETSALALIIGGLYLIGRKIADWRAPLGMLIGVSVLAGILSILNPQNGSILFHLFAGGIMLGAFFMVTDPVTSPATRKGRFIFGFLIGVMVMVIRKWGGLPEGVMYSILFMNAFVPLINRLTKEKAFGR